MRVRPFVALALLATPLNVSSAQTADPRLEKLKAEGKDMAFLRYGFRFRSGKVHEEVVHDSMEAVRERVLEDARRAGNPAQAIIEGVDDAWEVSIFKFAFEMIRQSWPINRFDLHRRGLL